MEEFFEKIYRYDIDIYRHRLHIVVTTNCLASVKKQVNNYDKRERPIRAMHLVLDAQGNSMLVLPLDIEPGELAHECQHACLHIIEEIGAGFKEEEFVCYLLGHLVDLATDSLKKAKKDKKALTKDKKCDRIVI